MAVDRLRVHWIMQQWKERLLVFDTDQQSANINLHPTTHSYL